MDKTELEMDIEASIEEEMRAEEEMEALSEMKWGQCILCGALISEGPQLCHSCEGEAMAATFEHFKENLQPR